MYSKNSFGAFYPVDSAFHRLNPIIKLINFIIAVTILILCMSLQINLFLFSLVFIMSLLSFVPTRFYFKAFYSLRFIYIIIAFACASLGVSLESTVVYIMKLVTIVEYLFILIYTTSPSELNYAIEKFFGFFNILGLNMTKISLAVTNFLRFIPLLITTENKILKSQSSRGIDYNNSDIIGRCYAILRIPFNTIRLAWRKNKDIKRNEEIRLFNIRRYRTNYRTNKVGFYDIMFFLFHLAIIIAYLVERGVISEILTKLNI